METNEQTIDDGVRHSWRFLHKSICLEKFTYNPLTAWKVNLKRHMGQVLDGLDEMQCSIVCKGKRYHLPILLEIMMENLPYFEKTGCGLFW